MNKIYKLFFLITFTTIGIVQAQHGNVRGFLYEKQTGEPIIFNSVTLKGTTYGAQTDVNGYYSITKIPLGSYTLMASALGFDTIMIPVKINAPDEIINLKVFLPKRTIKLRELVISADRQEQKTETRTGITKITLKDIKKIPTIGGEPDIAQFLQVLPGVTFTGDQGGQLYIRGGSPVQNKVLLDGMLIYNPFHSIGLFSVFDADVIRNADVSTGGFAAKYGGRISSVMDITSRDGNKNKLSGKISATTFGSKVLIEGPITKAKEEGGAASSFIITAKNSYLSKTAPLLYTYTDPNRLKFDFLDLYGKASFNAGNGTKLNLFSFLFQDSVKTPQLQNLRWNSYGIGSNFIAVPSSSQLLVKGNLSYSKYDIKIKEKDAKDRSSAVNAYNFGLDFTYFINKNELNYGLEISGLNTEYKFVNDYNIQSEIFGNSIEVAGFFRYKFNIGKLIVDPSFRLHYYATVNVASPEPRVSLKYLITDKFRFKGATGLYSQNLLSASSDRDIVNLFYGFIATPESNKYTSSFTQPNGAVRSIDNGLQRAAHLIAGFEYDVNGALTLNIEAYSKEFFQLININRDAKYPDNDAYRDTADAVKKPFIVENGYARGIDFNFKYEYKRFYIWGVYSLGYVSRWNGTRRYQPVFDRRHNANLVVAYTFGKRLDWDINFRFNLASGFPVTRTQGFYEDLSLTEPTSNYTTNTNGTLRTVYGPLNAGRLPYYHRLDIGIKKKIVVSENNIIEINAGCTNVYNRQNIFYRNRITGKTEYQLPIMPTIGANWTF